MRIRPSIAVGLVAWALYTLVTWVVQSSAGVPYAEWFHTAANAWRIGVLSLAAGGALLIVLVLVLRWRDLWRDPVRLETTGLMRAAMAFWWIAIGVRLVGIRWSEVPIDLLLAIVASGVLVGFAEETLFRGIVLRCLREGGRAESSAATWTAVWFGLFHLPNVFLGTGAIGLVQIALAALSGIILYVFRRRYGTLWPAMVAHGCWDISTFLAGGYGQSWLAMTSIAMQAVFVVIGIALFVTILRRDRSTIVIQART